MPADASGDTPRSDAPRLDTEKTAIFRLLAYLLIPFMLLLGRYRVEGADNLPQSGAVVVAPNHYSDIDPIVIGYAMWKLGRMPRFLAKASLFRIPIAGRALRAAGQVPVERSGGRGAEPLAAARRVAEAGHAVVIYPEGTLTRDPEYWPMRGKNGAVRAALDAGIPLVPVVSWGAQLILPRYKKLSPFPRKNVRIVFGPPLDLSEFANRPRDQKALADATLLLMNTLAAMLGDIRNETPPAQRWDPAEHGQPETGRVAP